MNPPHKKKCRFVSDALIECRQHVKNLRSSIRHMETSVLMDTRAQSEYLSELRKLLSEREKHLNRVEISIMVRNAHARKIDWAGWDED